jgi:hypothetical protein
MRPLKLSITHKYQLVYQLFLIIWIKLAVFYCHRDDPEVIRMAKISSVKFSVDAWAEHEGATAACEFCDVRLARRFRQVLKRITAAGEPSIPFACQDAAQSKAAYRFFSNPRVNEWAILSGHMHCTSDRVHSMSGWTRSARTTACHVCAGCWRFRVLATANGACAGLA